VLQIGRVLNEVSHAPGLRTGVGRDASAKARAARMPVAFVSMPFAGIDTPSIQIGLLKSIAVASGFPVTNYHLSLDFARQIGVNQYAALSNHRGRLFGEWLFSAAAFRERSPQLNTRFLQDFEQDISTMLLELSECPVRCLNALREREVPLFLDYLMNAIPWGEFRVIGFSSCFQQNVASLALAARIKERYPWVCTLFGGANFDGDMGLELVRTMDCIDYAIAGEADEALPEFLFALCEENDPAEVPGVLCRRGDRVIAHPPRAPFNGLDDLPPPSYDDYFERAESLGMLDRTSRRNVGIPFESSRGCWWGQKHHCTFCGLNALGMAFRAKSAQRVLDELADLALRYRTFRFDAVDNIISMSHLENVLPRLAGDGVHYSLFYETKANLKREQLALLRDSGVRAIQPGIESLSSHVLELMHKGVTAIQNVNLLRWALYYKIRIVWNLIWGFPGETEEDYRVQAGLIPRLVHLQPPLSAARIWMERFSPIYFDRERFPARRIRAERSYAYVYPESVDLDRVAYFFDYEFDGGLPESAYQPVEVEVQRWREAWARPHRARMTFRASPGFLRLEDRRHGGEAAIYSFTGPIALLYAVASNSPRSAAALAMHPGVGWTKSKIEASLNELCTEGLMMRDGSLYLSLAVPEAPEDDSCSAAAFR